MISEILNWKNSYNGRSNDPLSNMKIISDGVVVQLNEEEERSKRSAGKANLKNSSDLL